MSVQRDAGRTVLVVDDDVKYLEYIARGLQESGLGCRAAQSGEQALGLLQEAGDDAPFDLILLDVMMPGMSGWQFLERIRDEGHDTPVVFLTARHEIDERVKGLELGADDYVIKPFAFRELLARISAVLRRHQPPSILEGEGLQLDLSRRTVEHGGRTLELSPKEVDLLRVLLQARGRVCTRQELLRTVWGIEFDPGTNVVDAQVARLRRKLERLGQGWIETVVGQGYRLGVAAGELP